jgi:hypothetical protein
MRTGRGRGARLAPAVAFALLSGCGYVGAPLPPALDIPVAVTDLRALEYGDKILIEFTMPALTTEGLALKIVRSAELRAGPGPTPFSTEAWAASARRYEVPGAAPGAVAQEIPASDWIGQTVAIGVRATGPKGKTSAWSNLFPLTVNPPLARPAGLKAENVERGVALTWQGSGPRYRVLRAAGEGKFERLGETDQPSYLDETTAYGTRYQYIVQAISEETQQSLVSDPPVAITPSDMFPPAVPAGVSAAPGVSTIELAWERNTEPDFQGYNVYRAVEGGPFEKIASLIEAPTFSDSRVESGKRYRYQVSAVDMSGNESMRSAEVEAVAP